MKIDILEGHTALPEAADCARIHAAAFSAAGSRGWSTQEFVDLFHTTGLFILKVPSAFLMARIADEQVEILTFAVIPAHQRSGIGRALVDEFIASSARRGAKRAILEVAADNTAAISLYQLVGFIRTGCRKEYFLHRGQRIDAHVMEKDPL